MQPARDRHALATAASIFALIGGGAALTPASVAAATVHKCANQTLLLEGHQSESGVTTHVSEPIKAITTEGISCAGASQFFNAYFHRTTMAIPDKFQCKRAKFKPPAGLYPEVCSKPGMKIQFAIPAG